MRISEESGEESESDKIQNIADRFQQEYDMTHDPILNAVPTKRLLKAKKVIREYFKRRAAIPEIEWQERGPWNVGGRTRAILIDAADNTNNTIFAGGVAGGLWRTTNFMDESPVWVPINDLFENLAITCIVQDTANTNILYFGTGEGWFNGDAVRGLGIWKSIDGGISWSQLSSTNNSNFHYVMDLLIDANSNLYAATRNAGVQRSTDGGSSWNQVLGNAIGVGTSNRAADLELADNGDLYASLGVFSTGSMYISPATNGMNTGATGTWVDRSPSSSGCRRIEIACAPSDASRAYVICHSSSSSNCDSIYRTDNSGTTWTRYKAPLIYDQGSNSNFTRGQAWYDLIAAVDPNDEDLLYIGGVDALRSNDGGSTWEQITTWSTFASGPLGAAQNVHADHHAIVFLPGSSTQAIWGTDGGIDYTDDLGNSNVLPTFAEKNTGYNVTQFYACAMHPNAQDPYLLAGSQDNGTQKFEGLGMNITSTATGGDGGFCFIDQDNPNIQITSYVRANYFLSLNGGINFSTLYSDTIGLFINPTDYDDDENVLYFAYDPGEYGRITDIGGSNTFSSRSISAFGGSTVSTVSVDPNTQDRVWFGLQSNPPKIIRVDNADSSTPTATDKSITISGNLYPSSIAVKDGDPNHLLVTFSNYGVSSIWETTDGGNTWTDIENNLPDMPVRSIIFDPINPDSALIGTDLGVWSTDDLDGVNTQWNPTNTNLANVRVDMLQSRSSDHALAAATHGRGLYTARTSGQDYCTPQHFGNVNEYITNVDIGDIMNATGAPTGPSNGYSDYSSTLGTILYKDSVYQCSVDANFSFTSNWLSIWIDWDSDGIFRSSEKEYEFQGRDPYNFSLDVPDQAVEDTVRMRVRLQYGPGAVPEPCDHLGWSGGETEDYHVVIKRCPIQIKVNLEGNYNTSTDLHSDLLRQNAALPATEPFTALGFNHVNYPTRQELTDSAGVMGVTGPNAIVDWLFLELRDPNNPTNKLATCAALLQADGDVVGMDGVSEITLSDFNSSESTGYLAIRHRNHLGVRTANVVDFTACNEPVIDFTDPNFPVFGTNAQTAVGSEMALHSGDANNDGTVNAVDRNLFWRLQNGGAYDYLISTSDFSNDGTVNAFDRNVFWRPNNSIIEQLD